MRKSLHLAEGVGKRNSQKVGGKQKQYIESIVSDSGTLRRN